MNRLNNIDIFIFRLINESGFTELDPVMLLISNKLIWIPLYIFILYLITKKYKYNILWILLSLVVLIFAAAALLTPPDPITQIGLAVPLLILYELSIFSVKFIERKDLENEDA